MPVAHAVCATDAIAAMCHLYTYTGKCSPGDHCVTTATISHALAVVRPGQKNNRLSRDSLDRGTDRFEKTVRTCVLSPVHVLDTQAAWTNESGRSLAAVQSPSTSLLM